MKQYDDVFTRLPARKLETGDINTLPLKTNPVDNDISLIEDSEDGYKNKKVLKSSLGGGTSAYTDKLSDWYLPAMDELNLLYQQKTVIGGFDEGQHAYCSSTEYNYNAVRGVYFSNGATCYISKGVYSHIRPIRIFDFTDSTGSFVIGDILGEGKIFYVDATGRKGLIAANMDIPETGWGANTETLAHGTAIYTGVENTITIINAYGVATCIAKLCRNYVVGAGNSILATGIIKNTTATGVLSIAVAGADYVAPNAAITGASKTKISYDAKGLVTSGADATTADIADSTDKRYCTDAQKVLISNTSGANTGDQSLSELGAEAVANKENTTIDTSTTKYPTINLLKTGLDTKLSLDQTTPQTVTGTPTFPSLTLLEQADPSAPDDTHATLWVTDVNGKTNLSIIGSDGIKQRLGRDIVSTVRNTSGVTINKGKVVYVTGATGTAPNVALARANAQATLPAVGITMEDIANNGYGMIQRFGRTEFIFNTLAWTAGAVVYVDTATAGALTVTKPSHPNFIQVVGTVVVVGTANGSIFSTFNTFYNGESKGTNSEDWVFGATSATSQKLVKTATAARTATFPDKDGTVAMISDITATTPGGSVTQVQFNDGTFGGDAQITIDKTAHKLSVGVVTGSGYTGTLQNNGGGSWGKYKNITVTAPAQTLVSGYTVKVIITGADAASIFAGGQNALRLEYQVGFVELDRCIETFTSSNITIWFRLQTVITANGSSSNYRLYYSNPLAGVAPNDGRNVYLLWDDFLGTTIDTNIWTINDATGWVVGGGELRGQDTTGRLSSIQTFSENTLIDVKYRTITFPANGFFSGRFYNSPTNGIGHLNHPGTEWYWNDGAYPEIGGQSDNPTNTNVRSRVASKNTTQVDILVSNYDTGTVYQSLSNLANTVSSETVSLGNGYVNGQSYNAYWDWIRVRKIVEGDTLTIDGNFGSAGVEVILGSGSGLLAINSSNATGAALTINQTGAGNALSLNGGISATAGVPTYADNAAALIGNLEVGRVYKTATGILMIVY